MTADNPNIPPRIRQKRDEEREKIRREREAKRPKGNGTAGGPGGTPTPWQQPLPEIEVRAGERPRIIDEMQRLLGATRTVYLRGLPATLVRILRIETARKAGRGKVALPAGSNLIYPITAPYLSIQAAEVARWKRYDGRRKEVVTIDVPPAICTAMIAGDAVSANLLQRADARESCGVRLAIERTTRLQACELLPAVPRRFLHS